MMSLAQPVLDPLDTFLTCISRIQDPDLKARLLAIQQQIVLAAGEFDAAAKLAQTHMLPAHETVDGRVTRQEMSLLYEGRMVDKRAPGRPIYDTLLNIPQHRRCPFCAQRTVSTLDHYLPRRFFPALAVVPLNLVACCGECNKAKLDLVPTRAEDQTLHPYYDDIAGETWLAADVIERVPAALRFYIQPPPGADRVVCARIIHHFQVFQLGALYGSHGASEISNIRTYLRNLSGKAGVDGVRSHLVEMAASCTAGNRNSWQSAAYAALSINDWFCEGGFARE